MTRASTTSASIRTRSPSAIAAFSAKTTCARCSTRPVTARNGERVRELFARVPAESTREDPNRLQAGYQVLAGECLTNPSDTARVEAARYYDAHRGSILRRSIRRVASRAETQRTNTALLERTELEPLEESSSLQNSRGAEPSSESECAAFVL